VEEFEHELETGEGSFDFADGPDTTIGEDVDGGGVDCDAASEGELADDAAACFAIGHSDFDDHAGNEPTHEALMELIDITGMVIAGEYDACTGEADRVECAEEFFLRCVFVGEEMDIVDCEKVVSTHLFAEGVEFSGSDGGDVFVGEIFAGDVADGGAAVQLCVASADSVEEVSLSEPAPAVDAEWGERHVVVGEFECGVVGEFVSLAGDELIEVIARIEAVGELTMTVA